MPKTITATVVEIQNWIIQTDPAGDVDGITVNLLVNYGTIDEPKNHSEEFDLWATMNASARTAFQRSIFDRLNNEVNNEYLT